MSWVDLFDLTFSSLEDININRLREGDKYGDTRSAETDGYIFEITLFESYCCLQPASGGKQNSVK